MEWIVERFRPRVLVVERHPFNVLASWIDLDFVRDRREAASVASYARDHFGVDPPAADDSQLVYQAFYFGVLAAGLREATARHPEWTTMSHETLCVDSQVRFAALADELGLEWGDEAKDFLDASDADGSGYATSRRTEAQPERWRERLSSEQIATIRATLARFPFPLLAD